MTAELNLQALEYMSAYLNRCPRFITARDVKEIMACGVNEEEAVLALFGAACGLDGDQRALDRQMLDRYFRPSLRRLEAAAVREDPYLRQIRWREARMGRWALTRRSYEPYELFVRDDLLCLPDGREIPRLGYFAERFSYPAVEENGREWMTVTPNEIATMAPALALAEGDGVAMGLGLGYFAFRASEKPEVRSVTVVERDRDVIALFKRFLLPQFPQRKKIRLVEADAFEYAANVLPEAGADFCFVDLWHDVADGAPMYLRMKALAALAPNTRFTYWIETSLRCWLRSLAQE